MKVIRRLNELRREIELLQKRGKTVGFVPTMGAFHEGHLSLIRRAAGETDAAVVSLFVNPIQFDEAKDLRSYPRPWRKDLRLAARAGAKLLFAPTAAEMYPPGFQTFVEVEKLGRLLEGQFRPGHFRGVATVVAKLFHLVQPDVAYFGQKDAQQARLVERMIRDLNFPVRLKVLPTLREKDGLPLSSRNRFLSSEARRSSRALAEALQEARRLIECDEPRASLVVRR
ncbi:MAG: pantoate--beta-alanine ligase, partial [Candidatus Omnitrophica bacterium]|nr:pantoate--beta-alanine ligase [Candidatus Omnitrophota bacterium]